MKLSFRISPFAIVMLLISLMMMQGCKQSDESRSKILKIYNWADYIDEDLLTEFPEWYKEQTGEDIHIIYQVFDMTEVMYTKISLGKEDFDLACPTQAIIERMMHKDLVLPMDTNFGETPNYLSNISPFMRERLEAFSFNEKKAGDYVVPYMWGTSGILYNTHLIDAEKVSTWESLWNPANKGKILMKDSYSDAYNVAAIRGYKDEIASGRRTVYQVSNDHRC